MAQYRFHIGDRVRIVRPKTRNAAKTFVAKHAPVTDISPWTIERLWPADDIGPRYCVRAGYGISRVVHEDEIEKV